MMRCWTIAAADALGALMAASPVFAQGIAPPAELRGSYAPNGDCTKEPRVTLTDALTITMGGKGTRLAPIDSCRTCVAGANDVGLEVWVSQLGADGNPKEPMFRFNAGEKRGVLVVDKFGIQALSSPIRAVAMASPLRRCVK